MKILLGYFTFLATFAVIVGFLIILFILLTSIITFFINIPLFLMTCAIKMMEYLMAYAIKIAKYCRQKMRKKGL